jgi:hypothetical protein
VIPGFSPCPQDPFCGKALRSSLGTPCLSRSLLLFLQLFDLRDLEVLPPVRCNEPAEQLIEHRDHEPLLRVEVHRVNRIVVCRSIDGFQNWWLICGNAKHLSMPSCGIDLGWIRLRFCIRKKIVVGFLQDLMISGLSAEIEDELKCTYDRNRSTNPLRSNSNAFRKIAEGRGTENHYQEIEGPVHPLQRTTPRRVVERVSQDVEADEVRVLLHLALYFFGGGAGWAGCLGPTWVPGDGRELTATGAAGWRGPALLIEIASVVRHTRRSNPPRSFFPVIEIVSLCWFHLGMKGAAGCGNTRQRRHPITNTGSSERNHHICTMNHDLVGAAA